ncbi:MAG: 4a-hydroxytetrahydrobiopterin dehydratase [Gemmatimonadaceae bacterium]|nr:4a-hydroxytetrahydrobiopterin dehydratase [Acetobacteraceae bacterium]
MVETTPIERLTDAVRDTLPTTLPDWRVLPDRDALVREFRFTDFTQAWAFMTRVAAVADRQDHHPEWSNTYNRVTIALTTHDAGGLSVRDVALAQAIDAVVTG